jgi:hypothetical protein
VGGAYGPAQNVVITSAGADAIYYTTDGSTPTTSSTLYTVAVTVAVTETLRAIAVKAGYNNSAVGSASYAINGACGTPTFDPPAGTFSSAQSVTLASTNSTAIYYTTDGSTPTTGSTLYIVAIAVSASETIKAIGVAAGYSNSAVGSAAYVINTVTYLYGPDTGNNITPWNVQSWCSQDASFGNPAPSYQVGASSNPGNMNITAGVEAGCTITFDIYIDTGGTPVPQFLFGCSSLGVGNTLVMDGRAGHNSGIQSSTGWAVVTGYTGAGSAGVVSTGAWHTIAITISSDGTTASWTLDGITQETGVAIVLAGPFIGVFTYTAFAHFDNISVTASPD